MLRITRRGWLVVAALVIVLLAWLNASLPTETDGRQLPNSSEVQS